MLKIHLITGVAVLGLLTAMPVMADHSRSAFDVRQDRQDARIAQGLHSGELTRGEARSLERDQAQLARLERRLRSDGYLSKRERRLLQAEYDDLSWRIRALKHNDRYRVARYERRDWRDGERWGLAPQACR